MFFKVIVYILAWLTLGFLGLAVYGKSRWARETNVLRTRLNRAKTKPTSSTFSSSDLEDLPLPVRRYFQTVLRPGQPMISTVEVEQTGTFNRSEGIEKWVPFRANQFVVIHRPGFDWDANIRMFPGVSARVHDAYIAGEGILHVTIGGAVSIVSVGGTPGLAHGEFMRFVAEAVWYPTLLLPSQHTKWQAVDSDTAKISMSDGETAVTLFVHFSPENLITDMHAESRGRLVDGKAVSSPWHVKLWDYRQYEGMLIPSQGEAEWLMPDGPKPYWRGRITSIRYNFN